SAAVTAAEIIGIAVHVVVIRCVIRRLVKKSGTRTVGVGAAGSDVVDAGVAGEIAVGLIAAPRTAVAAAEAAGVGKALVAAAHHAADAVEQPRPADHAGGCGRRRA